MTGVPVTKPAEEHPRGLRTLFFTEMWERFSYYGMRALLVLFMVDETREGGLGLSDEVATAIYGLYTALVYLAAVPGGWVADRILGARRSVWYGGIIIACGHFSLAVPRREFFFLGLLLVVIGTGLLKPNVSALVGGLYAPSEEARRDAGFTIFYMGINLGAALGPLVCSALGERIHWHYGFACAGLGMVCGLVHFRLTSGHLTQVNAQDPAHPAGDPKDRRLLLALCAGILIVVSSVATGLIHINPVLLARATTWLIAGIAITYFCYLLILSPLEPVDKRRVGAIALLFVSSAIFWSGFEQAGSSLNLFAERYTQRNILNYQIPAGWFQALGPVFIIGLAPVVAGAWTLLNRKNINPPVTVKFALGLILLAVGFLAMAFASRRVVAGIQAGPSWLVVTYLFHSAGELCLSPVGLSAVTKLAPRNLVGQMLGLWFLATSLGNVIAGLVAGSFSGDKVSQMPARFFQIVVISLGAGIAMLLLTLPLARFMAERDKKNQRQTGRWSKG